MSSDPRFAGLTIAFRQTAEYKELSGLVRTAYPAWPEYLVETAIAMHVQNPRLYRDHKSHPPPSAPSIIRGIEGNIEGSVAIYSGPDDPALPPTRPCPGNESQDLDDLIADNKETAQVTHDAEVIMAKTVAGNRGRGMITPDESQCASSS